MLHAVKCGAVGVTWKKSRISHPQVGTGISAARKLGREMLLWTTLGRCRTRI